MMHKPSWFWSAVAVALRPWLWRAALRFVPNKPWKPSSWQLKTYIQFRMVTMYGDKNAQPTPADTIKFLAWAGKFKKIYGRPIHKNYVRKGW